MIIGERMNLPERVPITIAAYNAGAGLFPDRYVNGMLRLGAFNLPRDRDKYLRIGVAWGLGMNLCPPAPNKDPWPSVLAENLARNIWWYVLTRATDHVVYLAGRRVQRAFGHCAEYGESLFAGEVPRTFCAHPNGLPAFIAVPHPSGLNHWWNDEDNIRQLKERIDAIVSQRRTADRKC